jgi:hypothetical protein
MCRVLEVAVSGYYDWLKQPISNHDQEDARLLRLIRASSVASHGIYGHRRLLDVERHRRGRSWRSPLMWRFRCHHWTFAQTRIPDAEWHADAAALDHIRERPV